ncbi:hypothetical protein TYRP_006124 [Tyrophagus putrescentiae]|nr:hypothetical protein TYRP_006124 [Tyrophagus putrescentiae]
MCALITVLKFLEPLDQLKASKMSPRLRMLKIINSFFISSRPNLQKLKDDCGGAIDIQPKAVRVSKWNSLVFSGSCQEDLPTVEEIATVLFSAVTSLVFIANQPSWIIGFNEKCQYLVALLQYPPLHPHETTQLESLVLGLDGLFSSKKTRASVTYKLVVALNALTALQQLAVHFDFGYEYPDIPALTVLDQLKVLVLKLEWDKSFFLNSIGEQAAANVNLKIHLQGYSAENLSKYIDDWPEPLLSRQNRQLLHLEWRLDLKDQQNLDRSPTPPFQLTSVRALTLNLYIDDHSQAEWLHLPRTLPNCQAIHLRDFYCKRCRVNLWECLRGDFYTEDSKPTNSATALQCLRDVLSKLYPYFQRQQITLGEVEPYRTAAELFAEPHE